MYINMEISGTNDTKMKSYNEEAHKREKRRAINRRKKAARRQKRKEASGAILTNIAKEDSEKSDKNIESVDDLYPADIERGEFGFPIGSRFNDISFLSSMMKCVMVPKSHLLLLYRMMKDLHDLFVKHKIPYFVDGGTLLGVMRHKGLIPWDDDLDIGILPKDVKKAIKVINKLKPLGYGIQLSGSIIKIFIGNKWIQSPIKYSANPTLDIFIYHRHGNYIQLKNDSLYSTWPEAKYTVEELFPLTLYDFGPFKVYGPKNGRGYCDRLYPEWEKYGVVELRCGPTVNLSISKNRKVKLPIGLLKIFIPNYNVTDEDIQAVTIDSKSQLVPKCIEY